jgi:hypothetical protein
MGRIQAHGTPAVHTWCVLEGGLPLFSELPRASLLGNWASGRNPAPSLLRQPYNVVFRARFDSLSTLRPPVPSGPSVRKGKRGGQPEQLCALAHRRLSRAGSRFLCGRELESRLFPQERFLGPQYEGIALITRSCSSLAVGVPVWAPAFH